MKSLIDIATDIVPSYKLAEACGVTPQAFYKWKSSKRLPRTEFTGETNHAFKIEQATNGAVTKDDLLKWSLAGWAASS